MLTELSLSKLFAVLLNLAIKNNHHADVLSLEGKSFIITISELPQDIAVKVVNNEFSVLNEKEINNTDVTISGNIKDFINMIKNEENEIGNDLYVSGKINTAKQFQILLSSLSVDWQRFFANFLPTRLAVKIANTVEQGLSFAKGNRKKLAESLKEYIIEDKKLLVTKQEFIVLKEQTKQVNNYLDKLLKQFTSNL